MKDNSRKPRRWRFSGDDLELTLLALPTFVWYILFSFLPMFGIIIAFKDYKIAAGGFISNLLGSEWVGLKNFEFLFRSQDAWQIIRNTLGFNIIFIILGIVVPVTLAILLSQITNVKAAKFYQTSLFLPHFLSWVVVSYFLYAFLSPDFGIVNKVIRFFGGDPVMWYSEPGPWVGILIFMNLWKGMGYSMVVYLAGITGIDKSYYEAALIDGASHWQQVKYITLPSIRPLIIIMFIMAIGRIFNADFGLFYQVPRNSAALYNITTVFDTYVYRSISSANIGMSSAAAFFQSVMGFITIMAANFIIRRIDRESALF